MKPHLATLRATGRVFLGHLLLLMLVALSGCADKVLLHPSTEPAFAAGAAERLLEIDGRTVEVYIARSPGAAAAGEPRLFVLEFCGNATRAEDIIRHVADRWGARPVEVWVMNYPGYGRSTGPARLGSIPAAARDAYDALAAQAAGRPIIVSGNSLGTAVALHVAAERPAAGLVLQNPPPLQRLILQRHGWWNLWLGVLPIVLQVPGDLNSLRTAPKVKAPAIFIMSQQDSLVPVKYQQMVAAAHAGEKRLIIMPDAEHNSPIVGDEERKLQQELDWLWGKIVTDPPSRMLRPGCCSDPAARGTKTPALD